MVAIEAARDSSLTADSQQPVRPRSLSDISAEGDVGAVVLKAKRAAKSLWMIIHAQNCRTACCPHRGCQDTKKLLLHVKTCPAGPGFDCPDGFNGCLQARKLLLHYRRCRDVRARAARQPPAKRLLRQQQHSCLVCSLMARHAKAKDSLDSSGKVSPCSSGVVSNKEANRANNTTVSPQQPEHTLPISTTPVVRSTSMQSMPPPPPRLPQQSRTSNHQHLPYSTKHSPSNSLSLAVASSVATQPLSVSTLSLSRASLSAGEEKHASMCCTPPSQSVLQQQRIADVAAAAGSSPATGFVDPSLLGKSYDSSKTSYLYQERWPRKLDASEIQNRTTAHGGLDSSTQLSNTQRTRAVSYDERSRSSTTLHKSSGGQHQRYGKDRTVEADLRISESVGQREFLQDVDFSQSQQAKQLRFGKRRSASCSGLSTLTSSACDTIEENAAYDDSNTSDDEPIFICDDDKR